MRFVHKTLEQASVLDNKAQALPQVLNPILSLLRRHVMKFATSFVTYLRTAATRFFTFVPYVC